MDGPGYISREHTVWCGNEHCGKWDQLAEPKLKDMKAAIREAGWVFTRIDGWLCPNCAKKRRNKAKPAP